MGFDVQQRLAQQAQIAQDEVRPRPGPPRRSRERPGRAPRPPCPATPTAPPPPRSRASARRAGGAARWGGRPSRRSCSPADRHGRVHLGARRGAGGAGDDLGSDGCGHGHPGSSFRSDASSWPAPCRAATMAAVSRPQTAPKIARPSRVSPPCVAVRRPERQEEASPGRSHHPSSLLRGRSSAPP